jgi:hypothetical protein
MTAASKINASFDATYNLRSVSFPLGPDMPQRPLAAEILNRSSSNFAFADTKKKETPVNNGRVRVRRAFQIESRSSVQHARKTQRYSGRFENGANHFTSPNCHVSL